MTQFGFRHIARVTAMSFAALGMAAVAVHYWRDIDHARVRASVGSQVATTACGPIEYASAGERPPVLAVHGAGGGFDQGIEFLGPLAERGFRIVAMSRFGYLRTPMPADASAQAQADAHACLLGALGIPRAAVIGASTGAPSSMQFAMRGAPMLGYPTGGHLSVGRAQEQSAEIAAFLEASAGRQFRAGR